MNVFNNMIKNVLTNENVKTTRKVINDDNTISQASVESGYIDDSNSNSSDVYFNEKQLSQETNAAKPLTNQIIFEKKKEISIKPERNSVFCFEDQDSNFIFDKSDDDGDSVVSENEDKYEKNEEEEGLNMNINKNNDLLKYSCSVPRSIPSSFSNRIDFNKKSIIINQDENDLDDNPNLGVAFAQLASSIVYKDGTELFGDRPSRRIPINSISKSCFDN